MTRVDGQQRSTIAAKYGAMAIGLLFLVAGLLTAYALRSQLMWGDTPLMIEVLTTAGETAPGWIHWAVFPLVRAVQLSSPSIGSFDALQVVNGLAIGSSLGICGWLFSKGGRTSMGALATAALLTSPALIFHATVAEMHGLQLLGSTLLLGVWCPQARRARQPNFSRQPGIGNATAMIATSCIAVLLHRSLIVLVAGMLASRLLVLIRKRDKQSVSATAIAIISTAAAFAILQFTSNVGVMAERGNAVQQAMWLVGEFADIPSLEFLVQDVALVAPLALAAFAYSIFRGNGTVLLVSLPAIIGMAFFVSLGVPTNGGYLLSLTPWWIAASLNLQGSADLVRSPRMVVVGFLVGAQLLLAFGYRATIIDATVASWGSSRHEALQQATKGPVVLLSADESLQLVSGRSKRIVERPLWPELAAAQSKGLTTEHFANLVLAELASAAAGVTIALDLNWEEYMQARQGIDPYMDALASHFQQLEQVQVIEYEGLRFLALTPSN